MTKSRADLVNEALVRLGGKASGQDASNEDYAYVDGQVEPVLEDLAERNIAVASPSDIQDGVFNHIAAVLAFQCCDYFGVVGEEYTKLRAQGHQGRARRALLPKGHNAVWTCRSGLLLMPSASELMALGQYVNDMGAPRGGVYGVPLRSPYVSELSYFHQNPHVAGMAAEDNQVILNPFSGLSEGQQGAVAKNEAARVYMRQKPPQEFALTPQQSERFSKYGAPQDQRSTIIARILSGDASAGDVTDEQRAIAQALLARMEREANAR